RPARRPARRRRGLQRRSGRTADIRSWPLLCCGGTWQPGAPATGHAAPSLALRAAGLRVLIPGSHQAAFSREDFRLFPSPQIREEVGALPLDLLGRAGAVEGHDLQQRRLELLPGPGVFVMHHGRVGVPAPRNLPDRQPVVEPQAQQFDPAARGLPALPGTLFLQTAGLAEQRFGPGPVEGLRQARLVSREVVPIRVRGGLPLALPLACGLEAEGDVTDDAVAEGPEAAAAPRA